MPLPTTSIIIADDHPYFRAGLRQALTAQQHLTVLAEAENGSELCRLTAELTPDVVITDIAMPRMNGLEAARAIRQNQPLTGIIALSMYEEGDIIREAHLAGANAYSLKNAEPQELKAAVEAAHKGMFYLPATTAKHMNCLFGRARPALC